MLTAVEEARLKFAEAVATKGRRVTIRHTNPGQGDGFDPILGSYRDPNQEVVHIVEVVPMSSHGEAQFAQRMPGKFFVGPDYSGYSMGVGTYTPFIGDVLTFDGVPVTVVAIDISSVDGIPVHYQVGLKR